jgi:hypothetical protein
MDSLAVSLHVLVSRVSLCVYSATRQVNMAGKGSIKTHESEAWEGLLCHW